MIHYAVLEGKQVVPIEIGGVVGWAKALERGSSRVVRNHYIGQVYVSTVFLGLDHSFGGSKPMWFETMIFGGRHNDYQTRCETYDEAEEMHEAAFALVMSDPWLVRKVWDIIGYFREIHRERSFKKILATWRKLNGKIFEDSNGRNEAAISGTVKTDWEPTPPSGAS